MLPARFLTTLFTCHSHSSRLPTEGAFSETTFSEQQRALVVDEDPTSVPLGGLLLPSEPLRVCFGLYW